MKNKSEIRKEIYDMEFNIALIPGDGIGPEIVREACKVLDKTAEKYHHRFHYEELLMGGISIDTYGEPLTDETLEKAKKSDSALRLRSDTMSTI